MDHTLIVGQRAGLSTLSKKDVIKIMPDGSVLERIRPNLYRTMNNTSCDMFFHTGMPDPEVIARYPETIHFGMLRIPKARVVRNTTYAQKPRKSFSMKQAFAYLDRKHIQLTGKPVERHYVCLYADVTDWTVAQTEKLLIAIAELQCKARTENPWFAPAGFDLGVLKRQEDRAEQSGCNDFGKEDTSFGEYMQQLAELGVEVNPTRLKRKLHPLVNTPNVTVVGQEAAKQAYAAVIDISDKVASADSKEGDDV